MSATVALPDPRCAAPQRRTARTLFGIALAALLTAIGLRTGGGLALGPTTAVEMALLGAGGALGAVGILATGERPRDGLTALILFGLLAALTALSILWAVQPADAWLEANRTLAWLSAFGIGITLARMAGTWWGPLLEAIVASSTAISTYALATKVFPGTLSPDEVYARLREPYDYWNAVGLTAAMGVPACLWLGARRQGHALVSALAHPALAILLLTMLLAYSRGSLLAATFGAGAWFALVPLRLRGAAVVATATVGALAVAGWAFGQTALTTDRLSVEQRAPAGHELGFAIVAMVVLLTAAGLAIGFAATQRPPRAIERRRAGAVLIIALALVPLGLTGTLALSEKGLGGSLSDGWRSLTDPDAATPPNEPGRLTAVGSVRARYWNESLKIWKAEKLAGAGAGAFATARPRHRRDDLDVRHSHGYLVQTLADLGLAGLTASLALLAAWLAAAWRTTGPWRGRERSSFGAERVAMVTLLAIVVTFGVHSLVDWTWFIPGTAVPAMLCAGWLAGRGSLARAPADLRGVTGRVVAGAHDRRRAALAAMVAAGALAAAWTTWQPQRSVEVGNQALAAIESADAQPAQVDRARALARKAIDRNPLSVEPLFELAVVETVAGRGDAARKALEDAVRLQPTNPAPWLRLADYALHRDHDAARALTLLGPALHLDPRSEQGAALYLEASRTPAGAATAPATPPPADEMPATGATP